MIKAVPKQTKDERIEQLEQEVDELQGALDDMTDGSEIVDQLDSLAVACESVGQAGGRLATSVPQTPEQWARCLRAIAKGGEWESGTWK